MGWQKEFKSFPLLLDKLGRYRDKRLSFDSAQDDVTLSGVKVLTTLNFLYIKLL